MTKFFSVFKNLNNGLSLISVLNLIGAFMLCSIFLLWESGRAVYVLMSFYALYVSFRKRPDLPREQLLYSLPIYGFIGVSFLTLLYHGLPDRGLNILISRYFLLLLAIPLTSLFYSAYQTNQNIGLKFVLAAWVLGFLALVDIFIVGKFRADAGNNAVVFGFVSVAITSVVLALFHSLRQHRAGIFLYFSALIIGFGAMLLSGTRGSWIAGLAILFIAIVFYTDKYSLHKRMLVSIVVLVCLSMASTLFPQVQKRIDIMVENFSSYYLDGKPLEFNSLSYRVEVWKAAVNIGLDSPLAGIGSGNFTKSLKRYVEQNPNLKGLESMKHAHNQYFQVFATGGIPGILTMLFLVGSHLWLFGKHLTKRYSSEIRSLAFAGFLFVVTYALLGLVDAVFEAKRLLLLYGFVSASILGSMFGALKRQRHLVEAGK